jgi:hypothetical protein
MGDKFEEQIFEMIDREADNSDSLEVSFDFQSQQETVLFLILIRLLLLFVITEI